MNNHNEYNKYKELGIDDQEELFSRRIVEDLNKLIWKHIQRLILVYSMFSGIFFGFFTVKANSAFEPVRLMYDRSIILNEFSEAKMRKSIDQLNQALLQLESHLSGLKESSRKEYYQRLEQTIKNFGKTSQ